jgi:hypothetical protein
VAPAAQGQEWRPFLFAADGRTLARDRAAIESGVGYNGLPTDDSPRPGDARRTDAWLAAAVGLTDRVELGGSLLFGEAPGAPFGFGEGRVELRVRAWDGLPRVPVAVSFGIGYQADAKFVSAAEMLLAVSGEWGRFALTVNLRGIHYFADGRDPLDLFFAAAASVRATDWLRLGVEYVGEELEGTWDPNEHEVEGGGGRHYVGPSASVLVRGRVRFCATAGPVIVPNRVSGMARAAVAYLF